MFGGFMGMIFMMWWNEEKYATIWLARVKWVFMINGTSIRELIKRKYTMSGEKGSTETSEEPAIDGE
jgi:hypothetical protein